MEKKGLNSHTISVTKRPLLAGVNISKFKTRESSFGSKR